MRVDVCPAITVSEGRQGSFFQPAAFSIGGGEVERKSSFRKQRAVSIPCGRLANTGVTPLAHGYPGTATPQPKTLACNGR